MYNIRYRGTEYFYKFSVKWMHKFILIILKRNIICNEWERL